jgi:D-3-phosphoglycerate dehydrogenase
MKPIIWSEFAIAADLRERLASVCDVVVGGDVLALDNVAAIIIGNLLDAGPAFMDRMGESLTVIARPGIGIDNVNVPAATERGILVIHTPDAPTESTAEHAVALLLAVAKRVVTGARFLQSRDFDRSQMFGMELKDRVLGVVGFGRIGRRVAEICGLGLRMKIIVYDPFIQRVEQPGVELTGDLDYLLANADVVTLHTPLMAETRHLMNASRISRMKRGAYLINASRGPVVDEAALLEALRSGHLAGAGLDVTDPEPPLPDNPLLTMNNVVVTPHIASYTDRGMRGMQEGVADQLVQVFSGQRPPFVANGAAWPGRASRFQA